MQHVFPRPELFVKRDRRLIAMVGLNVNDPGTPLGSNFTQVPDQRCRNTLPAPWFGDRKVVDVIFAPCPFELVEFISDKTTDDRFIREGDQNRDVFLGEQFRELGIFRRRSFVRGGLGECDGK